MGLGLHGGGLNTAKWLLKHGAKLFITDTKTKEQLEKSIEPLKKFKNISWRLGEHRESDFKKVDLVVANPGVPRESRFLDVARANKIPIVNEATLFFDRVSSKQIVGITGTRGKSTVSTLTAELLKTKDRKTILAGNIRDTAMLSVVDRIKKESVVLELSSWQLEGLKQLNVGPHISVVTNVMVDHLNRYKTMASYAEAKEEIWRYQTPEDFVVLNRDNSYTLKMGKKVLARRFWFSKKYFAQENGTFIKNGVIIFRKFGKEISVVKVKDIKIQGEHNFDNVLASVTVAMISDVKVINIKKVLREFTGISSRQEFLREVNGVKFYNDTTATTPDGLIAALKTLSNKKNIVLLAGGADKNLDYNAVALVIGKRVKFLVAFEGKATDKLIATLQKHKVKIPFVMVDNMSDAVGEARLQADKGDIILLSPAAASFGLFLNEFDRGEQFNHLISSLRDL